VGVVGGVVGGQRPPGDDRFLGGSQRLPVLAYPGQAAVELVQHVGEAGLAAGVVGGQRPPGGDRFLGGFQRLPVSADLAQAVAEFFQRVARPAWWAAGLSAVSARTAVTISLAMATCVWSSRWLGSVSWSAVSWSSVHSCAAAICVAMMGSSRPAASVPGLGG